MDSGANGEETTGVHPDFEALYVENGLLRGELATLKEEAEYLVSVTVPQTQTSYTIQIGALHAELFQLQTDVTKIRRRLVILRDALQRGDVFDESSMSVIIDREFAEWDDRLRMELAKVEEAKARFSSLVTSEDELEIRSLYRILARKMDPEINPDQGEEAKSFWPNIQSAYRARDLFHLKALLMMAEDYPESYDLPSDIGSVRASGERLRRRVNFMNTKLTDIKSHVAFEWRKLLDNPHKLAKEQTRLREEIEKTRFQRVALEDMLRSLELKNQLR